MTQTDVNQEQQNINNNQNLINNNQTQINNQNEIDKQIEINKKNEEYYKKNNEAHERIEGKIDTSISQSVQTNQNLTKFITEFPGMIDKKFVECKTIQNASNEKSFVKLPEGFWGKFYALVILGLAGIGSVIGFQALIK